MKNVNRFTLVTTAKNEGPYFLEWIAYHRLIGFDDFIIFQNDSDDCTHEILSCLSDLGLVNYKYNRADKGKHQIQAYRRAVRQPEYLRSDWVMALDMDEFLCLQPPLETLDDWFEKLPEADQVYVNWAMFGNSGLTDITPDLVSERFQLATPREESIKNFRPFKTLFRRSCFQRPGIHMPVPLDASSDTVRTINASGLTEQQFEQRNFQSTDPGQLAFAQVNHYVVRDAASFVIKSWKGSAHQANRSVDQTFWQKRNRNQSRDETLSRWSSRVKDEMQVLDDLSDGRLMQLRKASIDWHRRKFHEIIKDDYYRDLFSFCCLNNGRRAII
ncbi:glycosyltransferase family 2 protein [Paracoccus sp. PARArs4]|uniref:glycosyltransferase family 2 protein n=1 Tax=Paracoccus sp. PARArs4 TaxID=2853442 RepID=UPI0024A66976|nr:glycosyltransferase family 2 protein [Paracoccus sp. PARArs4]